MANGLYPATVRYSKLQLTGLVLLRVLIGWHFLYEGVSKLLDPRWTSASYLIESKGFLSEFFTSLAANPTALKVVDVVNIWALILIGLSLICGCLSQIASIGGAILLLLYYLCLPPFPGFQYSLPMEGSYLVVNKVLIELAALLVLALFPSSHVIGIDRLIFGRTANRGEAQNAS